MNKYILYTVLLAISPLAGAGAYKWTDADGQVHYGDRPPVETESSEMKVESSPEPEQIPPAEQPSRDSQADQETAMAGDETAAAPEAPEDSDECTMLRNKYDRYNKGLIDFSYEAPSGRKIVPAKSEVIKAYEDAIARACGEVAETDTGQTVAETSVE